MPYKTLKKNIFQAGDYALVPLRHEDIFKIVDWRNDQIDILRQKKPLTKSDQESYFNNTVKPTFAENEPRIMLFSLLLEGECIAYGGLVYIDWEAKRAEVSFLADTKRANDQASYREDFLNFIKLLGDCAFSDLGFNRLFFETYDVRPRHISIIEEAGYKLEGRMREHVKIRGKFVDSLIHSKLRREHV